MGHSSGEDVHSIYTHVEISIKRDAICKLQAWVQIQEHEYAKEDANGRFDDNSTTR